MEIPKEPVFVITDRVDTAHHQTSRPTYFDLFRQHVGVFPADPEIFLVNTNRVVGAYNTPVVKHLNCIEVDDFAKTITSKCQRVHRHPEPIFA